MGTQWAISGNALGLLVGPYWKLFHPHSNLLHLFSFTLSISSFSAALRPSRRGVRL